MYREVTGLVRGVMEGANASVLTFGQTGSGKAHTLAGTPQQPGINFRAMSQLFQCAPCPRRSLFLQTLKKTHMPLPTVDCRRPTFPAIIHQQQRPQCMS